MWCCVKLAKSGAQMKVRLMESCKRGRKGEVIELRDFLAMSLIKKSLAVRVEGTCRLGDLYFGKLVRVVDKYCEKTWKGVEPAFECMPLGYGIFKYAKGEYYKHMLISGDYYTNVVNNRQYITEQYFYDDKIKVGQTIIESESAQKLTEALASEIAKRGWNEDTKLSDTQLAKFEQDINEKLKYFIEAERAVKGF